MIGLVAPLGADLEAVTDALAHELRTYGYSTQLVRLSGLIEDVQGLDTTIDKSTEDRRIETLMEAGTEIRHKTRRGDILALMSIPSIRRDREAYSQSSEYERERGRAYILRSFKNRAEIDTLRDVYGAGMFVVSIYMPKSRRCDDLSRKIAASHYSSDAAGYTETASRLIDKDEEEEGRAKLGQDVGGAFPLADYFVDVSARSSIAAQVKRFVEIIFSHPFQTPLKDEFGMFQARGAALRSSDLSRQVGAAIANSDGDVVALGCNDVPKWGGGLYWSDDERDERDFQRGYDSSAIYKHQILAETLARLRESGIFGTETSGINPLDLAERLISGDLSEVMEGAQITQILEYGRIVHAEMAAISDAVKRGVALKGATLYCTTFPCHMCARHIIAAGIGRVVYIEPYPKSKSPELYRDSIEVDMVPARPMFVNFQSFVGVAPRRYMDFFEMVRRKDKRGTAVKWTMQEAVPRVRRFTASYQIVEKVFMDELAAALESAGLDVAA